MTKGRAAVGKIESWMNVFLLARIRAGENAAMVAFSQGCPGARNQAATLDFTWRKSIIQVKVFAGLL